MISLSYLINKEQYMKCKKCGAENLDDAKFCASCGSRLDARFCRKCGRIVPDGAKFCNYCGALIDPDNENANQEIEYNQENTIRCRICGHINPNTENYCKLCGSQLTPNNEGPKPAYNNTTYAYNQYDPRGDAGSPCMVIGIISLILSISTCLGLVGIILGIVGLIKSIIVYKNGQGTKSKALTGIVCSTLAIVIGLLTFISIIAFMNSEEFQQMLQEAQNSTTYIRMLIR